MSNRGIEFLNILSILVCSSFRYSCSLADLVRELRSHANVTVEEVTRGREESRPEGSKTRSKSRGQSKELVARLNARVDDVEKSTGDLKVRIDDLDHHLEDV